MCHPNSPPPQGSHSLFFQNRSIMLRPLTSPSPRGHTLLFFPPRSFLFSCLRQKKPLAVMQLATGQERTARRGKGKGGGNPIPRRRQAQIKTTAGKGRGKVPPPPPLPAECRPVPLVRPRESRSEIQPSQILSQFELRSRIRSSAIPVLKSSSSLRPEEGRQPVWRKRNKGGKEEGEKISLRPI